MPRIAIDLRELSGRVGRCQAPGCLTASARWQPLRGLPASALFKPYVEQQKPACRHGPEQDEHDHHDRYGKRRPSGIGGSATIRPGYARVAQESAATAFLLTVLQIAPELERTHDLECQIASRASHLLAAELSPRCRGLVERMGELARDMWRRTADSWYQRDGSAASALAKVNDEMHELHTSLVAELASGQMPSPVTIEMALAARFYERLGDHAVNITRRVGYLAWSTTG